MMRLHGLSPPGWKTKVQSSAIRGQHLRLTVMRFLAVGSTLFDRLATVWERCQAAWTGHDEPKVLLSNQILSQAVRSSGMWHWLLPMPFVLCQDYRYGSGATE